MIAVLRNLLRRPSPDREACANVASSAALSNGVLLRLARGPVLMLDIDGVLHPAQSGSLIYLPLLETWLRQHQTVDVVISSNWRDTHTLNELRALFSPDLRERVIGTTPNLDDGCREDEILALASRHHIARWVALDDRPQDFPKTGGEHLIATEYFDGISIAHLERAARALGLQP